MYRKLNPMTGHIITLDSSLEGIEKCHLGVPVARREKGNNKFSFS